MNQSFSDKLYENLTVSGNLIVKNTTKAKEIIACSVRLSPAGCLRSATLDGGITIGVLTAQNAVVDSLLDDFVESGCSFRDHSGGDIPDNTFDDNIFNLGIDPGRLFIRVGRVVTMVIKMLSIDPVDETLPARVFTGLPPGRTTHFQNECEVSGNGTMVQPPSFLQPTVFHGWFCYAAPALDRLPGEAPGIYMFWIVDSNLAQDVVFGPPGGSVIITYEADGFSSMCNPIVIPTVSCNL